MLLLLKLTLVPMLIWGISVAGRIWGPSVAGWLSAFPVVTGPILLFIGMEQGRAFAADAAGATLSAILAHLSFGLGYAWVAVRRPWWIALPAGLCAYVACLLLLSQAPGGLWPALPVLACVLVFARRLFPSDVPADARSERGPAPQRHAAHPLAEMLCRMAAGAALVMAVTWMAAQAGPHWSGLLAMFPVLGVVLAVFSHRQMGGSFTVALLRNMVWGYFAFATFCTLLALMLRAHGLLAGFVVAVGAALMVQAATLVLIRRQAAPAR
ncbi:MAG: hypothetical protein QM742_00130 [Aquabacterium sp.]